MDTTLGDTIKGGLPPPIERRTNPVVTAYRSDLSSQRYNCAEGDAIGDATVWHQEVITLAFLSGIHEDLLKL